MIKKIVKKYGDSLIVSFTSEEQKIYGIEVGDILEISDMIIIKKSKRKSKK